MNKPFIFIIGKPHTISAQIRHVASQLDALRGRTVPAIRDGGPHDGRHVGEQDGDGFRAASKPTHMDGAS